MADYSPNQWSGQLVMKKLRNLDRIGYFAVHALMLPVPLDVEEKWLTGKARSSGKPSYE